MLCSYSVIVPVLNRLREIASTLDSIADSIAFFNANHPRAGQVHGEVIVVDEGSTDGTVERVHVHARTRPRLRLVQHHRSFGIGAARNTGVRMAVGDVLFFCDGDDLFLPEHVFVGFSLLDHSAGESDTRAETIRLRVGSRGHLLLSAAQPLAAIRTGVRLGDSILPHWKTAIENTIAQCLCVRRECHDWGEGFPEEAVYKRIGGCEDVAYGSWLSTFFRVGRIDLETVEYVRRPGNSFDQQLARFTRPPGSEFDRLPADQQPLHDIRMRREDERVGYLLDKWCVLGAPPLPPGLLNWEAVVAELLSRHRMSDAIRVAEQARQQGQTLPPELVEAVGRGPEGWPHQSADQPLRP